MKQIFLSFFMLLAGIGVAGAEALQSVTLKGGREYLIALPSGVANPPLILALHGGGGNPAQFERAAGLTTPALKAGYAVAYPAGSGRKLLTWNAIYCCGAADRSNVDDIAFLDSVIADAKSRFGIDASRVFITGMSNGGMMAETYGALRPRLVKAIASVAGPMDVTSVKPKGAVPLLHIHGTEDKNVVYTGGYGPRSIVKADFTPVEKVLAAFRSAAPGGLKLTESVIDTANDGMSTDKLVWSKNGVQWVVHYRVNGGGHAWPGARGPGTTRDFDASTEILKFFNRFR